jgi:prophage regulatory protein
MTDKILRIQAVRELTGLSRSSIYRLAAEGRFPAPVKLSERASGWRESALRGWIDSRTTASNGGAQQ